MKRAAISCYTDSTNFTSSDEGPTRFHWNPLFDENSTINGAISVADRDKPVHLNAIWRDNRIILEGDDVGTINKGYINELAKWS